MVMRVDHDTRAGLAAIGSALASGRADELTETLLAVCDHPDEVDHEAFAEEVERAVLARVGGAGPLDMGAVLGDMRGVVRAYGLEIPGKLDLLAQVAAELEGTVRHVDADFRMTPVLHAVVRRLAEQRLRPEALLERGEDVLRHLATGRRHVLRDVRAFVERIGSGRFEVVVRHTDADEAVDRLTYGMLTAALLVGAPIVWHADPPPRRNGVSVPGAALTGAGVLMAAGLLRGGRRRRTKPPGS